MNNKIRTKCAFTLAEVLITLVIIGIVAALTIPVAISKYKERELVSGLKKTYSTLSQATSKIIAESGSPSYWASSSQEVYNQYIKHLSYSKACGNSAGCWYNNWNNQGNLYKMILSDGTLLMFHFLSSACTSNISGSTNVCASIWVDVNGNKPPNKIGYDLFDFVVNSKGLYPRGCDSNACPSDKDACACKVIREGEIKY